MVQFIIYNLEDDFDDEYPDSSISIKEYLETTPEWKPALEDTFLIFDQLTESTNMDLNPFGLLYFIYPQLIEIKERLQEGKFGVLRSSGDWKPTFFIFEPHKEKTYFSILGYLEQPYSSYYPLKISPKAVIESINEKNELYNYITKNRNNLRPDFSFPMNIRELKPIAYNTAELLTSLTEQAKLAEKLINYLK